MPEDQSLTANIATQAELKDIVSSEDDLNAVEALAVLQEVLDAKLQEQ